VKLGNVKDGSRDEGKDKVVECKDKVGRVIEGKVSEGKVTTDGA